jgi:hypothetical protein
LFDNGNKNTILIIAGSMPQTINDPIARVEGAKKMVKESVQIERGRGTVPGGYRFYPGWVEFR